MTHRHLSEMVGGWFVGDFTPTCVPSTACEVACKAYPAGARESAHVHLVATEVTLIATGRVRMAGREFGPGDLVILSPGEPSDFETLEPTLTVVVKMPSVRGDKYPATRPAGEEARR
jgi:hypothetical protein